MTFAKKTSRVSRKLKVFIEAAILALLLALLLRTYVVQAYRIPSGSMEDVLMAGDFVLVYKLSFRLGEEPKPGDIVVFRYPLNPSKTYIKRIIALPGETVQVLNKQVYVNGRPFLEPPTAKNTDQRHIPGELSGRDNFGPLRVGPNQYFVMGDNRDQSEDSRFWGTVDKQHLIGKAMFVYWSWQPDPSSPKWESPYIVPFFELFAYYMTNWPSKIRWSRIGSSTS